MRTRPAIATLVVAQALAATVAKAQPDLPPPPPPPMGLPTDLPPARSPPRALPSPGPRSPPVPGPAPTVSPQAPSVGRSPPPAPTRRVSSPPAPLVRRRRPEVVAVADEEPRRRLLALTINPLPVLFGRVSGNAEILFLPHHSLVLSPNALLFHTDRGGRGSVISEGMGFATRDSSSLGLELGYHFWWWWRANDALRGPFVGPSLLVGTTSPSSVDPSRSAGYWGLAVDVGAQEVLRGGFTVGAGAGLGFVRIAQGMGATAFFPRLLVQVGWSL
jgi:hypothetical protein